MSDGLSDCAKLFGARPIPAHMEAAATLLEHYAARIRRGESPYDFGKELTLVAQVIARQI